MWPRMYYTERWAQTNSLYRQTATSLVKFVVQTELKLVSHFITITTVQSADQLYLSILAESCLKLEGMLSIVCAFLLEAGIKDIVASHTYISLIGKHNMVWMYIVAMGCQQDRFKVLLAEWPKKDSDV